MNYFKNKTTYFINLTILATILSLSIWLFIQTLFFTEAEIIEMFAEQDLIGASSQRGAQSIEMFVAKFFGKIGFLVISGLAILAFTYLFSKELQALIRFLRKGKLFKDGDVNNMYDDYVPSSFLQFIRNLFKHKKKSIKDYPSEKYMQEELKKNKYLK